MILPWSISSVSGTEDVRGEEKTKRSLSQFSLKNRNGFNNFANNSRTENKTHERAGAGQGSIFIIDIFRNKTRSFPQHYHWAVMVLDGMLGWSKLPETSQYIMITIDLFYIGRDDIETMKLIL